MLTNLLPATAIPNAAPLLLEELDELPPELLELLELELLEPPELLELLELLLELLESLVPLELELPELELLELELLELVDLIEWRLRSTFATTLGVGVLVEAEVVDATASLELELAPLHAASVPSKAHEAPRRNIVLITFASHSGNLR